MGSTLRAAMHAYVFGLVGVLFTLGIATLEAGLHVMIEKPVSAHKADAERLIALRPSPTPSKSAELDVQLESDAAQLRFHSAKHLHSLPHDLRPNAVSGQHCDAPRQCLAWRKLHRWPRFDLGGKPYTAFTHIFDGHPTCAARGF